MPTTDAVIAALLRERRGYEMFDRPDRVAEVDAQLKELGYTTSTRGETKTKPERATKAGAEKRGG